MAEKKTAKKRTTTKRTGSTKGFTAEERAAMKERAKELKAEAAKADGEKALLAKIAEMKGTDRAMAKRLHEIITAAAPDLAPKTWYGMPAYAKDGKIVCFFQSAEKFDARYATFGFSDEANHRPRRHVADLLRAEGADRRRGEEDRRAREEGGALRSMATKKDTRSPAPHVADSHDLIRVQGARVNNLKDVSVEIPKRRLTVFTGVSGSGKSSLVFGTIAAESQRLINETYSAFVQGFMPTLARPEVDVLEGLTTAIIVDQERMGSNPRSTVGTATDANAMLRILFSRLGKPHIGSPNAYSFNVPLGEGQRGDHRRRGPGKTKTEKATFTGSAACVRAARAWARSPTSTCPRCTTTACRSTRARSRSPATAWTAGTAASSAAAASSTRTSRSASTPRRSCTTCSTRSRPRSRSRGST